MIFHFLISFLCRVILTVKNVTISFDPQDPLTLSKNFTKLFDPEEPFQDLNIFLKIVGSTRYWVLYLAKRRDHQRSPSHIVVWSCDLIALLWKLLYQRLIDFGHLIPIANNLWSAGVTASYLNCWMRLS